LDPLTYAIGGQPDPVEINFNPVKWIGTAACTTPITTADWWFTDPLYQPVWARSSSVISQVQLSGAQLSISLGDDSTKSGTYEYHYKAKNKFGTIFEYQFELVVGERDCAAETTVVSH